MADTKVTVEMTIEEAEWMRYYYLNIPKLFAGWYVPSDSSYEKEKDKHDKQTKNILTQLREKLKKRD